MILEVLNCIQVGGIPNGPTTNGYYKNIAYYTSALTDEQIKKFEFD